MNRLRVRVELNRRKAGVPMQEMLSVVEETHKFFQLLAEDVNIDASRGEWQASNFDPEALNFTAEFDGPATPEQIRAFGSSFSGSTSLRSETIAQFTRIADFIGEDELVGFGLYQHDDETEPSEWRCLSRRDALRFADEIQMLAKAAGVGEPESALAVMTGSVGGRRLFKDRREREALTHDPAKWIREVESNLSRRIAQLEGELQSQTRKIQTMETTPDAEEKFLKMLAAMETYWNQAPKPLALPAPESTASVAAPVRTGSAGWNSALGWGIGLALACAAVLAGALWSHTKPAPIIARIAPAAPAIAPPATAAPSAQQSTTQTAALATLETEKRALADAAARREATPELTQQIPLEIPTGLRPLVTSDVLIDVNVDIDRNGRVTKAEVVSTKGDGGETLTAGALKAEALKAARRFRFRPARQGKKTVPSQTSLTFTFSPDASE
jgi:TonB family protein